MKKLNTILIVLILIFLVGCNPFNLSDPGRAVNFKQGHQQIDLKLVPNYPPSEIYENSQFMVLLELNNNLGYDVENLKLNLVGIDNKYFEVNNLQYEYFIGRMEGKSSFNPLGDKEWVEISLISKELFENARSFNNPFYIRASYNSNFELSDSFCVNPSFYDFYGQGCKMDSRKRYSGQGAPVSVEEITTAVSPSGTGAYLRFNVIVKNRGNGKLNSLFLREAKMGTESLECNIIDSHAKMSKVFTEKDQEARITCEVFLKDRVAYETLLYFNFDYEYNFQIKGNLRLVN